MRKLILTLLALTSFVAANAQQWVYASTIGAVQGTETPTYSARDASGNLYVASNFDGTRTFGTGPQTSTGIYDVYVTKFDANGAFVWFRKFGAVAAFLQAGGLTVDQSGNIYVAGSFTNQIIINGSGVSSNGGRDIFIFKIDPAGTTVWGKTAGGPGNEEIFGLSAAGGKIYMTGSYSQPFTDGSVTLPSAAGNEDIFVSSYSQSNGNCAAMVRCGGLNSDVGFSISASTNAIYVTGSFIGMANFGTVNLTSANTQGPNPSPTPDLFLTRMDSSLAIAWAVKAGAGSTDQGNSVSQDAAGNAYVAGYFLGAVNFGNGITLVEANGYGDGFLVKYNPSGVCQWGQKISSGVSDAAACVSTDPLGSSYVTGAFGASVTITGANSSNASIITTGSTDGFIAKWGTDGTLRWAIKAGSTSDDRAQSVTWGANGNCHFVVNYSAPLTIASLGTYPSPGGGYFGQLVGSYSGLTTGLSAVQSSVEVSLFPNPVTSGNVTVKVADGNAILHVAVYTVEGRLVFEQASIGDSEWMLQATDFTKGNYFVTVTTREGVTTQQMSVN